MKNKNLQIKILIEQLKITSNKILCIYKIKYNFNLCLILICSMEIQTSLLLIQE